MSDPNTSRQTESQGDGHQGNTGTRTQGRQSGGNQRRQARSMSVNNQSYTGECEDLEYILALHSEKFDKKVPFQVFMEKLATYVVSHLKDGGDVQMIFTEMKDPTKTFNELHKPIKPERGESGDDDEIDEVDLEIYKEEVKQFVQRKMNLRRNMEKSYGLVWGQCSNGLQTYIKGLFSYETQAKIFDVLWLIRELKKATSGIDDRSNTYVSMHDAISTLYRMKQGAQETNDHYLARFKTNVNAVELAGGAHLFFSPELAGADDTITDEEKDSEIDQSKAILLLKCADDVRYGDLSDKLREGTYLDRDEYPRSIAMMYDLMTKVNASSHMRSFPSRQFRRRRGAVTLVQQGNNDDTELIPGTDGRTFEIVCYNCNKRGHYASNCPETSTRVGVSNLQVGYMLAQAVKQNGLIPEDWILLDTCSTDNVVNDKLLVNELRKCYEDEKLTIHTNGGRLTFHEIGSFKYLPLQVYYNPDSIANVLLLKAVAEMKDFHIEMNTKFELTISLVKNNRRLLFKHNNAGLYHCTIHELQNFYEELQGSDSVMLLSMGNQEAKYTTEEVERANRVRDLQKCMMWPSRTAMNELLNNPSQNNSDLSSKDLDRAIEMFGEAPEILAGKMTAPSMKKNQSQQILLEDIDMPCSVHMKLYVDVFHANGIPFLHTKSKDANFISIQKLPNRKGREIRKKLKFILMKYKTRGLVITDVFADNEFKGEKYEQLFLPRVYTSVQEANTFLSLNCPSGL